MVTFEEMNDIDTGFVSSVKTKWFEIVVLVSKKWLNIGNFLCFQLSQCRLPYLNTIEWVSLKTIEIYFFYIFRAWQIWCLVKALFIFPHVVEGARDLSGVSFVRVLVPCMRAPPSWPNHFPKTLSPNTISLGIRMPTYEFRENTNIQPIAHWILK